MAGDTVDYKALFLREKEKIRQIEKDMQQIREQRRRAESEQFHAEEQARQQAEEKKEEEEEVCYRKTSLDEFLRGCHRLLSLSIQVEGDPRHTTNGAIGTPTDKLCPTYLRPWVDWEEKLGGLYQDVRSHLQQDRLFSPIAAIEGFKWEPLADELDLEFSERLTVMSRVRGIVEELRRRPAARAAFGLAEDIMYENHAGDIDTEEQAEVSGRRPVLDQFCIHQVSFRQGALLTVALYKPPHKLTVGHLRSGLRPMNLWEEVVQLATIPEDKTERLVYNAERITASVLVQEYHAMVSEGLSYSYITNGLAYVLLYIDYRTPETLYYHCCIPNMDVGPGDPHPWTSIACVLCICLISCRSVTVERTRRNEIAKGLHKWNIDFDSVRAQIPEEELYETPPGSEYEPFPASSFAADDHRPATRPQTLCASPDTTTQPADSDSQNGPFGQRLNPHLEAFCTQKRLLGLQRWGRLDTRCPNVGRHRQGDSSSDVHLINADQLVRIIKQQLDKDLDRGCTPFGVRGRYGQPFKVTCREYGYTVVGKGTTDLCWDKLRREVDVYRVLYTVQGSVVPVFLGPIDLEMTYHVHGAGSIRHMLLMSWGGDGTHRSEYTGVAISQIKRSARKLSKLGVVHGDLRDRNILWKLSFVST